MSEYRARRDALDLALRHLGPSADTPTIFSTADAFRAYLTQTAPAKPAEPLLTAEQILDVMLVAKDPVAFLERVNIPTIDRGSVTMQPFEFQKDLVRFITTVDRGHVNHARQMGVSTCIAATALWLAMYGGDDQVTMIIARSHGMAIEILDRVRHMYEALPEHLRSKAKTYTKTHIVFENGASIWASAATRDAVRGRAITNLFIDQAAWISHSVGYEFLTTIEPHMATGCRCIITSTAGDTDGFFYDLGRSMPRNGFKGLILPWHLHPHRDAEWAMQTRDNLGEAAWKREFECHYIRTQRVERSDKPAA